MGDLADASYGAQMALLHSSMSFPLATCPLISEVVVPGEGQRPLCQGPRDTRPEPGTPNPRPSWHQALKMNMRLWCLPKILGAPVPESRWRACHLPRGSGYLVTPASSLAAPRAPAAFPSLLPLTWRGKVCSSACAVQAQVSEVPPPIQPGSP